MSINGSNSNMKLQASEVHQLLILQCSVGNTQKTSVKTKIEILGDTWGFNAFVMLDTIIECVAIVP